MPNQVSLDFYKGENPKALNERWTSVDRLQAHDGVLDDITKAIEHAQNSGTTATALSIGEGTGPDAKALFAKHFNIPVLAVDASENLIEWAKQNAAHDNIEYMLDTWPDLKQVFNRNQQYNVVFSCATLQELPQDEHAKAVASAIQLTKPGGVTIIKWPTPPTREHHANVDVKTLIQELERQFNTNSPDKQKLQFDYREKDDIVNRKALNGETIKRADLVIHKPKERKHSLSNTPPHLPRNHHGNPLDPDNIKGRRKTTGNDGQIR